MNDTEHNYVEQVREYDITSNTKVNRVDPKS